METSRKVFPPHVLDSAITISNDIIAQMSEEERMMYLFDRICDETCRELYGDWNE